MAQTKRKRRTKHRGNAAGQIEVRGRTGRPPSGAQKRMDTRQARAQARTERLDKPPTWSSAINRSLIAVAVFVVALILIFKQNIAGATALAAVMLVVYVPMSYYTDKFVYNRRRRRKAGGTR